MRSGSKPARSIWPYISNALSKRPPRSQALMTLEYVTLFGSQSGSVFAACIYKQYQLAFESFSCCLPNAVARTY